MARRRSLFVINSDSEDELDGHSTNAVVESTKVPKWRRASKSLSEATVSAPLKAKHSSLSQSLLWPSADPPSSASKSLTSRKTRTTLSDDEEEDDSKRKVASSQDVNKGKLRLTNLTEVFTAGNQKPKPRMLLRDSLQQMLGKSFDPLPISSTPPASSSSSSSSCSSSPSSSFTSSSCPSSRLSISTPIPSSSSSSSLSVSCCSPVSSSSDVEEVSLPVSQFTSSSNTRKRTKKDLPSSQQADFHEALVCIGALKAGQADTTTTASTTTTTTTTETSTAATTSGLKRNASLLESIKQERKKYCSLNAGTENKFLKHDLFDFETSSNNSYGRNSNSKGKNSGGGGGGGKSSESESESKRETKELWVDKYAPTKEAELCVHAKKIKDIKTWIVDNFCVLHSPARRSGQVLLLLDGPPGSAKASSVRAIANTLGLRTVSWMDEPDGMGFEQSKAMNDMGHEYSLPYEGRMKKFKQFFARSKRYPALSLKLGNLQIEDKGKNKDDTNSNGSSNSNSKTTEPDAMVLRVSQCAPPTARKIILIQEFPFVAGRDEQQEQFREVIRDVLLTSQYLVVFVVSSHHEKNNDLLQIFGQDLMAHPKVAHISCNPVAATGIAKALDRVIEGEHLSVSDDIRDQLVRSSNGDVRNAIHSLQFEALIGAVGKPTSKRKKARPKDTPVEGRVALGLRDVNYSIFHSLGKILHAKVGADPENIIDNSEMTDMSFTEYLHQNYMEYLPNDDFPRIQTMLEIFSDSDVLSQAASQRFGNSLSAVPESYGSTLAVRGYLSLKTGAMQDKEANWNKKGFLGHRGPLSSKVQRICENYRAAAQTLFVPSYDLEGEAIGPCFGCPSTDLFVDILPFLACVVNPASSSTIAAPFPSASVNSFSSAPSLSTLIRSPAAMPPRISPYSRSVSHSLSSPTMSTSLHQGHWAFLKQLCWEYGGKYQVRDIVGIFTNSQSFSTNWTLLKPPTTFPSQACTVHAEEIGDDIEEC